jgi:hypothetical protein
MIQDPLNGVSYNFIFGNFTKIYWQNQTLTKTEQKWTLHMKTYMHFNWILKYNSLIFIEVKIFHF